MSLELIILVVGILLVLISILGGMKSSSSPSAVLNPKALVTLGIIGICLIIYGGFSYGSINQQAQIEQVATATKLDVEYPVQKVQVISPIDGESVQCRILTMGVYPDGHDKDIWVLVRPSDELYYPQSDHTNTSFKRNGEWQVITRFGGSKDEEYDIIVYEADAEASRFFTATIEEWKNNLSYPGLTDDEIPDGATEVNRIMITLEENCRGVF